MVPAGVSDASGTKEPFLASTGTHSGKVGPYVLSELYAGDAKVKVDADDAFASANL